MPQYRVTMTHKMRSIVTVIAENEAEAEVKAHEQSFLFEDWEERDTDFESVEIDDEL